MKLKSYQYGELIGIVLLLAGIGRAPELRSAPER